MMGMRVKTSFLIILILGGVALSQPSQGASFISRCMTPIFEAIQGTKNHILNHFQQVGAEFKKDGIKRILMKDKPVLENPPDQKWWGMWQEAPRNGVRAKWYRGMGKAMVQYFPQKASQKIFKNGKTYNLVISPLTAGRKLLEKIVLPRGKEFTPFWKLAGNFTLYPLTIFGMYDHFLTKAEEQKVKEDLDFLVQNDYRFAAIKEKYQSQWNDSKVKEKARQEAYELKSTYEAYSALMTELEKQGISFDDISSTSMILSDKEILNRIGPLFSDVANVVNPKFYESKPYIEASGLKQKDIPLLHELAQINHLKIGMQMHARGILENDPETPAEIKEAFSKSEFYQKLKGLMDRGTITIDRAEYLLSQKIDWTCRLKMFKAVGVTPFQINKNQEVTQDTLRIENLDDEILGSAIPQ